MPAQNAPIKASTQEHLDIEDIRDDLVVLKSGGGCLVLTTTAVNFGLLSEAEQDATIYAYAGFLNSLSFPIQIFVRSQRKDISFYLGLLKKAQDTQAKPLLKELIKSYRLFVEKLVSENEVLDKKFYVVIPFSPLELGISNSLTSSFKQKKKLPFSVDYILEKAKMVLYPKRDHLIAQFGRLGLRTRQLSNQELLELFYHIYNPEAFGLEMDSTSNYRASLVAVSPTKQANNPPVQTPIRPTLSPSTPVPSPIPIINDV